MANKIQLRRGTKAQLAALGPLAAGEPVYTTDTKELIIGNGTGANTPLVSATSADITYYVRTDGNDNNTGLANTAAGSFKTISKAISMIPVVVNHKVLINIGAGTYAEAVIISGISGSGEITVTGSTVVDFTRQITNIVNIRACSCAVNLRYIAVTTTISRAFEILNSAAVALNGVTVNGVNTTDGFGIIVENTDVTMANCVIGNKQNAVYSNWGALVYAVDCSGSGNVIGYQAGAGGRIQVSGTTIPATTPTAVVQGGFITSGSQGTVNPWGDNTTTQRSHVLARISSDQALSVNTFTKVAFDYTWWDHLNEYSAVNRRFTAKKYGVYLVTVGLQTANALADGSVLVLSVYKNGARYRDIGSAIRSGSPGVIFSQGAVTMEIGAGEYLEIWAWTDSASAAAYGNPDSVICHFSVTQIA